MSNPPEIKTKQYDSTVVDFVRKDMGHFLVASHDHLFLKVLRNTINKHLAIDEDCITQILNENHILKAVREATNRKKMVVFFIERTFNDKESAYLIKQIKNAFSMVKIIILTGEADRQRLVLLHEIGADNFITKPISINTLIEKIAFTVKPQGRIGKLIDTGKQLIAQGSYEQALKLCRALMEIKPNSAAGFLLMGDAFRGLGKKDKAVESYEQASESAQMYLEPLRKLAEFYEEEGDMEQQLKYLEKLDRLSPLNVERKVEMGGIHVEMGNETQAEELFDRAMEQAQKEAMSHIEDISKKIAKIYKDKDPEKAIMYYRKALEAKGDMLDKSDIGTFNALGIALRKQGRWREAIEEYKKAQRVAPDDENLCYNIAMAFAEGKDFRRASQNLERALDINPACFRQDAIMAYNFGLIFVRANYQDEARRFLEASLEINPAFESPRKLLQNLTQ